jgi:hypothetical protein
MAANNKDRTILRKLVRARQEIGRLHVKSQMLNENGVFGRPSEVTSTQLIAPNDFEKSIVTTIQAVAAQKGTELALTSSPNRTCRKSNVGPHYKYSRWTTCPPGFMNHGPPSGHITADGCGRPHSQKVDAFRERRELS